jgi:hypothetical protein
MSNDGPERRRRNMSSATAYEAAAHNIRRPPSPAASTRDPDLSELIRLGSLAASSHNTQPWKFEATETTIRVIPDFSRRCPVVDPDDAHLYKSLGCAAENIVHAATAQGRRADVEFDPNGDAVVIELTADPECRITDLAEAIVRRQCTKTAYDGGSLDDAQLAVLEQAGTGNGVRTLVFTDDDSKRTITDFVNRGNRAQLSDPHWRRELFDWIRPNDRAAVESGDGLAGRTSGQPSLPGWLAPLVVRLVVKPKSQVKTDTSNIESSAGVAVFVSDGDHRAAWVETGRCYERFALQATVMGVRNAFVNQPIEVASIRTDFERWLGLGEGERAQLMVRIGTGPQMPFSLRRPLDEVTVPAAEPPRP